jgi:NAD(P)-dependent dehydrogenase (short-subunit alcohol dehydrogenase family)
MFTLTDKSTVVTGGASGIGLAIATLFARQKAEVHILDVEEGTATAAAKEIMKSGGKATAHKCDVANQAEVDALLGEMRVDILVNNAGVGHVGDVTTTTEADMDRLYNVNIKGVYNCARAVVPKMVDQGGGVILNLASIASLIGVADRFSYSMTKGAVLSMTRSVAIDYVKDNIRCNCVCPARIHTPFVDDFLAKNYPGEEDMMFKKLSEYQPIGRMGTPEEVAHLALYLCSDEASFVTGQAYPLDGGVLMG